jgi:uncharacterized membrane protein YsdA (DUF1294 family)
MVVARSRRSARPGSHLAIASLVLGVLLIAIVCPPRPWVAAFCLITSMICFALYAVDKRRARSGGWRVSERTLLFWGLIGGWPGAILAQHLLRHKTRKAQFRRVFRITVAVNVALYVAFTIPVSGRFLMDAFTEFSTR